MTNIKLGSYYSFQGLEGFEGVVVSVDEELEFVELLDVQGRILDVKFKDLVALTEISIENAEVLTKLSSLHTKAEAKRKELEALEKEYHQALSEYTDFKRELRVNLYH